MNDKSQKKVFFVPGFMNPDFWKDTADVTIAAGDGALGIGYR